MKDYSTSAAGVLLAVLRNAVSLSRILLAVFCSYFLLNARAFAEPSRQEVYRNEQLKIFVYKDNADANLFWYLPPLRLMERDGRVVFYKRPKPERTDYYFYIVPYITDELLDLMASEIPQVQSRSQLRPVIAKKFGIRIPQFDVTSIGTDVTDYQYINTPQLVKLSLDPTKSDDFEFFLENIPGVRSDILFYYNAERVDKFITISLSCKDVYEAMRIGVTGRYEFIRAEVEDRIFDFISSRNLNIRGRGDLPMPDIVSRALMECFMPVNQPRLVQIRDTGTDLNLNSSDLEKVWGDQLHLIQSIGLDVGYDRDANAAEELKEAQFIASLVQNSSVLGGGVVDLPPPGTTPPAPPTRPPGTSAPLPGGPGIGPVEPTNPTTPVTPGTGGPVNPAPPSGPGGGPTQDGVQFVFKRDAANIDRSFFYHREQYADSSEITSIPIMLTTAPPSAPQVVARPYPPRDFVVTHDKSEISPYRTGILVGPGDQLLINAAFAFFAESSYDGGRLRQFRWTSTWPNPQEDLYYRVGTGPWTPVNGRKVIGSDTIQRGELQFYVDRRRIWEKIPAEFKNSRYLGIVPAIFTYAKTYPQYNIVVTGRNVVVGRP